MSHEGYLTNQDIREELEALETKVDDIAWMLKECVTSLRILRKGAREPARS